MTAEPGAGLVRGIRRWDLVAVTINAIIGAGIFGLPSKVFGYLGAYSLWAFVACAILVTLIILCFAEVASRFRETGGPYLYAHKALGSIAGFEVGWLMWLTRLAAFAANCNLLVKYLGFFWPAVEKGWWRAALITVVVSVLATVNLVGIRRSTWASNFFTIAKLIPLTLFIAVGVFFVKRANFSAATLPPVNETLSSFAIAVLLLVYAFTGFEMAVILAGEARDPERDLPRSLLTAIAVVTAVYILVQVVCIGTLPELASSERPLADAGRRFMGTAGAAIISIGAVVSILGNLNITLLAASRVPFAMAARRQLPALFATTHTRFHTPWYSIVMTSGCMLALTLSGTFIYAVTVSTLARLAAYSATVLALLVLRRKNEISAPLFRVPGGSIVAGFTLLLVAWLLANSTWREARDTAVAGALGFILFAIYWAWKTKTAPP